MEHLSFDDSTPLANELSAAAYRRKTLDEAQYPHPSRTRLITVTNQKGGVGKTTSAVNLAASLAKAGLRVIVVDLDPQGNATTALGIDHREIDTSIYDVLVNDVAFADALVPSAEDPTLLCVPASIDLAGAEIELVSLLNREGRLRVAINAFLDISSVRVDYIFIDCPPSLGLLTVNAFVAAHEVLIPIQCEYYALEGLSQLLTNIARIQKHLNSRLQLSTILLTMYDARTRLASEVAEQVREHFSDETLTTVIPRAVRVSEAPSYGQSVIAYDPGSVGALAYREAALELARRGN